MHAVQPQEARLATQWRLYMLKQQATSVRTSTTNISSNMGVWYVISGIYLKTYFKNYSLAVLLHARNERLNEGCCCDG